jgi:hypothetical protein
MRKLKPVQGGGDVTAADEALSREGDEVHVGDYASLGSHVASVLEAATAAAARVRDEAQADAQQIRAVAEAEASSKIAEASSEASRIAHEAEGLRREAEQAVNSTRERAEAFAARRRDDAEAEAAIILGNAEQVATRQHEELVAREQALRESIDLAEKRLRHLGTGFRELADQLDEILASETLAEWSDTPDLNDVLGESVRRQ